MRAISVVDVKTAVRTMCYRGGLFSHFQHGSGRSETISEKAVGPRKRTEESFRIKEEGKQESDAKPDKGSKVHPFEWLCVEYGVFEKLQRYFRHFPGIEHRMRKMEMGEQFNKESKQGWRFATDAARITDKKTSSRIFLAVGRLDTEE